MSGSAPPRAVTGAMMGPSTGASTRMWKATIRGLFARKVRLALTALAILLGVAFVSATYVLTDSVKRSFESVFGPVSSAVAAEFPSPPNYDVTTRQILQGDRCLKLI